MPKVLLVVMPFYSASAPAPAPSLLKPVLEREGISCKIAYFNMRFAEQTGPSRYQEICRQKSDAGHGLIGERLFAEELFGSLLPDREEYLRYLRKMHPSEVAGYLESFLDMGGQVRPFLEQCLSSIRWEDYDVVGFSSMFEQNLASLALATRLKERYPDKPIVFGGANCDGEMGLEMHRRFPCIDYVCCGESDASLPVLVQRVVQGLPVEDIPGVVRRTRDGSQLCAPACPCSDLDLLPFPDYDDYFMQLHRSHLPPCEQLSMETSRGCWWGARSQCRFCGLNPDCIVFRSKSPARVLAEMEHLIGRYCIPAGIESLVMTDNILSMTYFSELMPELARRKFPVRIFYEVKANLSPEQVRLLAAAGVAWVQPGIESMSSDVLKLMSKGVDALQNIQFLKSCVRHGIEPVWNLINGIPGEKEEEYRRMLELIEKLHHLPAPSGHSRFELQRFSPFFNDPERFGILNVRPKEGYRFVYPFRDKDAARLAYYFDFDYAQEARPPLLDEELAEAISQWQEDAGRGERVSVVESGKSAMLIEDERNDAQITLLLEGVQKEIYRYCDQVRSFEDILLHVRMTHEEAALRPRDLRDFLLEMVSLDLMATDKDHYLSLALPSDAAKDG